MPKSFKLYINSIRNYKLKLAFVLGNTSFMLVFTILLQYTSIIRFDETEFYKLFAIATHDILKIDNKSAFDSTIFIDVSKDPEIVDDSSFNYGKVVITDRHVLADFFSTLNQHPNEYKYVFCDISFDYNSPNDPALKLQIEKNENLIISASFKDNKVVKPIFNVPYGCVDYTLNKGSFIKMPLFYDDSTKSLPVKLAEYTTINRYTHRHGLTFMNNRLSFNTVVPEFYYRRADLITIGTSKSKIQNLYYLGELLTIPDYFNKFLKNKFIIMGDFSTDNHATFLGPMPGALILFDTYLTLKGKPIVISWVWLTLLFLIFFTISYFIFIHPEQKFEKLHIKTKLPVLESYLKKYVSYLGIFSVINIISYLFFREFISLFFLATYLTFLELLIEKRGNYLKSKNFLTFIKEEYI
ncbi:MAG: hypothetical protein ABI416_10790 [Ginsengibacter sp.]